MNLLKKKKFVKPLKFKKMFIDNESNSKRMKFEKPGELNSLFYQI